jgi:O-antigen/teichoic acid export membrane protein
MPESAEEVSSGLIRPTAPLPDSAGSLRTRSIRLTTGAAAGMAARLVSAGGNVIIIPLVLRALGQERFGVWAVIMSLNAVTGFADLGLGNGLVNRLASIRHSDSAPKSTVASGFYALAGAGALIGALAFACYVWLPWASLLHLNPSLSDPARNAFLAWACCTALSIPLSCAQKLQLAWQENERIGLWQALSAILALASAVAVARLAPSLTNFVLAIAGSQCFILLANHLVEFRVRKPWLQPKLADFRLGISAHISRSGAKLALLQCFAYLGFFCDNLLIAHNQGMSAVAKYSVMTRVFFLIFLGQYFTAPLWSAFANAHGKGEWPWMRTIFRRGLHVALIMGLSTSALLLLVTMPAIRFWVGASMQPDFLLLAGFAAWNLIATLYVPITGLLSIDAFLWAQVRFFGIASISAFALKLVAVRYGASWVIWCAAVAYGAVLIPTLLFIYRRCFDHRHG